MAKYQHKTSGVIFTMTKEAHKKLKPELQKKYIEVVGKKKNKVEAPAEASEDTQEQE